MPNPLMDHFRLRPISEPDIDQVVENAGGKRAHPDADRREQLGADYVLGNCVIELKALDDEGLAKPERQAKLAALFRPLIPINRLSFWIVTLCLHPSREILIEF